MFHFFFAVRFCFNFFSTFILYHLAREPKRKKWKKKSNFHLEIYMKQGKFGKSAYGEHKYLWCSTYWMLSFFFISFFKSIILNNVSFKLNWSVLKSRLKTMAKILKLYLISIPVTHHLRSHCHVKPPRRSTRTSENYQSKSFSVNSLIQNWKQICPEIYVICMANSVENAQTWGILLSTTPVQSVNVKFLRQPQNSSRRIRRSLQVLNINFRMGVFHVG